MIWVIVVTIGLSRAHRVHHYEWAVENAMVGTMSVTEGEENHCGFAVLIPKEHSCLDFSSSASIFPYDTMRFEPMCSSGRTWQYQDQQALTLAANILVKRVNGRTLAGNYTLSSNSSRFWVMDACFDLDGLLDDLTSSLHLVGVALGFLVASVVGCLSAGIYTLSKKPEDQKILDGMEPSLSECCRSQPGRLAMSETGESEDENVATEAGAPEAGATEAGALEPAAPEPVAPESEPVAPEPAAAEPAVTEPAAPEPTAPEPAASEPVAIGKGEAMQDSPPLDSGGDPGAGGEGDGEATGGGGEEAPQQDDAPAKDCGDDAPAKASAAKAEVIGVDDSEEELPTPMAAGAEPVGLGDRLFMGAASSRAPEGDQDASPRGAEPGKVAMRISL